MSAFTIPDTSPREIVDAEASAHLAGTRRFARRSSQSRAAPEAGRPADLDPATVHGQAEGDLTLALKLGKTRQARGHAVPSDRNAREPDAGQIHRRRKIRAGEPGLRRRSQHAEDVRPGSIVRRADPHRRQPRARRRRRGDAGLHARPRGARQARPQLRLAERFVAGQDQGAAEPDERRRRDRSHPRRRSTIPSRASRRRPASPARRPSRRSPLRTARR